MKKTTIEKERALLEKIETAKEQLSQLKQKRKIELGELAIKAGLNGFDDAILERAFERLHHELSHEHQKTH